MPRPRGDAAQFTASSYPSFQTSFSLDDYSSQRENAVKWIELKHLHFLDQLN